ncbi:MAG: hypothetical protein R2830_07585 [Saprospiraceae bacterium]
MVYAPLCAAFVMVEDHLFVPYDVDRFPSGMTKATHSVSHSRASIVDDNRYAANFS